MNHDSAMARHRGPGTTVLVVEDDRWTRLLLHDLLAAHGYGALLAGDAHEALQLARDHRPGLILMDIHLPGSSGLEAVRRLKADPALRAIPVIAVTALAMREDEAMIREGGCADYLSKPFSSAALLESVERCLAAGSGDAETPAEWAAIERTPQWRAPLGFP